MNKFPVILVHGLFGWGKGELPFDYWGNAIDTETPLRVMEAAVGPVSSFHDRACELIAQIKGTIVDYGKEHSSKHGHARFGKDYSGIGFHPKWSATNPVHLVGHSAGGNTMRMAQHLLDTNFHGYGTNGDWVKSISCISAVLNGTALPYLLGCDDKTGRIKRDSIGEFLFWIVQGLSTLTGDGTLSTYDFDLKQWGLNHDEKRSIKDTIATIISGNLLKGMDNLAYDLTMQGCYELNGIVNSNPNTYYFGYGTEQTSEGLFSRHHYPNLRMMSGMVLGAIYQGAYDFEKNKPIPANWGKGNYRNAKWRQNDGCVPLISQYYPFTNDNVKHTVSSKKGISNLKNFTPGKWYYECTTDSCGISFDHTDIVCGVTLDLACVRKQKEFYTKLWERLASLT